MMMKNKKKSPAPVANPNPKPRPQFTTDFVDRDKYKLSQAQMIQKKAALQSKHRQEAIVELQKRRQKLEMGIVDEDTRPVYETALTAKNIDLNPTVRRNLSQMIQYERERQPSRNQTTTQEQEGSQEEEDDEIERQLKEAQAFIKKFERAKKTDKIERAVDILTAGERPKQQKPIRQAKSKEKHPQVLFQNPRLERATEPEMDSMMNTTQEDVLSSIEDTIRFMEQRLFSAGRQTKTQTQQSSPHKEKEDQEYKAHHLQPEAMEISGLELKGEEWESGGQCLDTIRRVREMMDGGQSYSHSPFKLKENSDRCNSVAEEIAVPIFEKRNCHHADSEAEVDFSLTLNNSAVEGPPSPPHAQNYHDLQQQLADEVYKLQVHSFSTPSPIQTQMTPTPSSIAQMPTLPSTNPQLAKLRQQIKGNQASIESMRVQPLKVGKPGVIGVDFRGSFNIRKNTTSNQAPL